MGEKQEELRDELVPDTAPGEEEDFALDSFDMLRVIGTGTFARVCLCQVSFHPPLCNCSYKTKNMKHIQSSLCLGQKNKVLLCNENLDNVPSDQTEASGACHQ